VLVAAMIPLSTAFQPPVDCGRVGVGVLPAGRFRVVSRPEKREVLLHGHRLAYRIGGGELRADGGPVLLLVHGMASSSTTWRLVLPGLMERWTVVAPDLIGHGASDKPRYDYSLGAHANILRDLMIMLGIERATVVGHSLGGGVAMQFAYQHPQHCERLVLVSSGGLGPEVSWILRALTLPGAEYLMPVLFPSLVREAGNALGRTLFRLGVRPPFEEHWRSYASLTEPANRHAFVRTLRSVIDTNGQTVSAHDRLYLADRLSTLILWGRHDRIIPVEHANAAHHAISGSQLVIFEASGHFPHTEEPQHFVEVVTEFVSNSEPRHLDGPAWRPRLIAGPPT
jgi:pimeloyl-ACP methyl ester carboxylesterase